MAAFINELCVQKLYTEFVEKSSKSDLKMLNQTHERANAKETNRLKSKQERQRDERGGRMQIRGMHEIVNRERIPSTICQEAGPWKVRGDGLLSRHQGLKFSP